MTCSSRSSPTCSGVGVAMVCRRGMKRAVVTADFRFVSWRSDPPMAGRLSPRPDDLMAAPRPPDTELWAIGDFQGPRRSSCERQGRGDRLLPRPTRRRTMPDAPAPSARASRPVPTYCAPSRPTRSTGTRRTRATGSSTALPGVRVERSLQYDRARSERYYSALTTPKPTLLNRFGSSTDAREHGGPKIERFVSALPKKENRPTPSFPSTSRLRKRLSARGGGDGAGMIVPVIGMCCLWR